MTQDWFDEGKELPEAVWYRKGVRIATLKDNGDLIVHVGNVIIETGDLHIKTGSAFIEGDLTVGGTITSSGSVTGNGNFYGTFMGPHIGPSSE